MTTKGFVTPRYKITGLSDPTLLIEIILEIILIMKYDFYKLSYLLKYISR